MTVSSNADHLLIPTAAQAAYAVIRTGNLSNKLPKPK
jgi:hypothetical protein